MLVTNYFPEHGGGVEIVAHELSRRVAEAWDVRWFASGAGADTGSGRATRVSVPSWNGIERRTGLPIPIPTPRGFIQVVAGVRSARTVWIHDILYLANIVAAVTALITGRPVLVTVHIGSIPYRNRMIRALMAGVLAIVGGLILPRARAVTFVSQRVREEYSARWSLPQAQFVPNGVDADRFRPASDADRRATRTALGVGNEHLALFVGRFVERKGLRLLQELVPATSATSWVFAGDGPLSPEDWGLRNVHVLRRCKPDFVARLYGAADLVVLPSVGEGFPLVVQEALATGARILIDPSSAAGYPEVEPFVECEPAEGEAAVERWRSHMQRLLSAPDRADEQDERRAFARQHWSWDAAADSYDQTLRRCIDTRATSVPVPAPE
jgi:glycosyltransferase involved in cell wall biosynthesis